MWKRGRKSLRFILHGFIRMVHSILIVFETSFSNYKGENESGPVWCTSLSFPQIPFQCFRRLLWWNFTGHLYLLGSQLYTKKVTSNAYIPTVLCLRGRGISGPHSKTTRSTHKAKSTAVAFNIIMDRVDEGISLLCWHKLNSRVTE